MQGKRMWHTIRLFTILSAAKRTKYYKDNEIFHSMGENCLIMDRKVPLYAKLISLGNNVNIASKVHFNTHDITHRMFNNLPGVSSSEIKKKYYEKIGCIEIGDNVFIGEGTSINYNVRIGSNVIIGSRSLITKDVPDNCVVGGVPARVIASIEEYLIKRDFNNKDMTWGIKNELVSHELENLLWNQFRKKERTI